MQDKSRQFTERIQSEIPIAKSMGVAVVEISDQRVILSAPLKPNSNHKKTAFGGSVYSVAVLSCWSLVSQTVSIAGLGSDYIVVQDATVNYLFPVEGDFTAISQWPNDESRLKFIATLSRRGLARAELHSEVKYQSQVCAHMRARFVAQIRRT